MSQVVPLLGLNLVLASTFLSRMANMCVAYKDADVGEVRFGAGYFLIGGHGGTAARKCSVLDAEKLIESEWPCSHGKTGT